MKSLSLILSLSLVSPASCGWFLSDDESRKYQIPQAKPEVKIQEQTLSQIQYDAVFKDYDKRAAVKAHFDKLRRESPDFVLFNPVSGAAPTVKPETLTQVNRVPQVNIAPQAIKQVSGHGREFPNLQASIFKTDLKIEHIPMGVNMMPTMQETRNSGQMEASRQSRSWVADAAKAVVSAVKAVIVELRNAINYAAGQVFSVLSGDAFRRQDPIRFDPVPGKPAVISINGMLCNKKDGENMGRLVANAFGVSKSVVIRNDSGPLRFVSDALQVLGHEILGAQDKPVKSTIKAIKQGIAEKGSAWVVAHSQGTGIFALALRGLTKEERSKVHYYGAGSQWFIDQKKWGLASARNVRNAGDPVPGLSNKWNVTNFVNPTHFSRVGGDWEKINVRAIGNEHSFTPYYAEDMANWANEIIGGENE